MRSAPALEFSEREGHARRGEHFGHSARERELRVRVECRVRVILRRHRRHLLHTRPVPSQTQAN